MTIYYYISLTKPLVMSSISVERTSGGAAISPRAFNGLLRYRLYDQARAIVSDSHAPSWEAPGKMHSNQCNATQRRYLRQRAWCCSSTGARRQAASAARSEIRRSDQGTSNAAISTSSKKRPHRRPAGRRNDGLLTNGSPNTSTS